MRVLLLCKRFYTNKDLILDRYGRLFHLPVQLGQKGWDVLVLATSYRNNDRAEYQQGSTSFQTVALTPASAPGYLSELRSLMAQFSPDVVIASGDSHFGWIGKKLARKFEVPFAFDVYDNYRTFASARLPGMGRVLDRALSEADLVVFVSKAMSDLYPKVAESIVIPNGVDPTIFSPRNRASSREETGLGLEEIVVGYFGALERDRGLETLFAAVSQLRDRGVPAKVLLAGESGIGHRFPEFVEYRGFLEQGLVPAMIGSCDVVVLPYPDTDWARYTSPNKLYEYLACGVPAVVTDISDYREVLGVSDAVSRPGDASDMARAIEFQLDNGVLPPSQDHSWAARADVLIDALEQLVR